MSPPDAGHAREVTVRLLVGVLGVLLVRSDELVVEVQAHAVAPDELTGNGEALQEQDVHLLVYVEVIGLVLGALVGEVVGGESPQGSQGDIRATDA